MSDDLEKVISKIVIDLMFEAHDQGITLSFEDICTMVGIPGPDIPIDEADTYFTLNEEFIDALSDKELRSAMIERSYTTIH